MSKSINMSTINKLKDRINKQNLDFQKNILQEINSNYQIKKNDLKSILSSQTQQLSDFINNSYEKIKKLIINHEYNYKSINKSYKNIIKKIELLNKQEKELNLQILKVKKEMNEFVKEKKDVLERNVTEKIAEITNKKESIKKKAEEYLESGGANKFDKIISGLL